MRQENCKEQDIMPSVFQFLVCNERIFEKYHIFTSSRFQFLIGAMKERRLSITTDAHEVSILYRRNERTYLGTENAKTKLFQFL